VTGLGMRMAVRVVAAIYLVAGSPPHYWQAGKSRLAPGTITGVGTRARGFHVRA
jgi:hypothetical protein